MLRPHVLLLIVAAFVLQAESADAQHHYRQHQYKSHQYRSHATRPPHRYATHKYAQHSVGGKAAPGASTTKTGGPKGPGGSLSEESPLGRLLKGIMESSAGGVTPALPHVSIPTPAPKAPPSLPGGGAAGSGSVPAPPQLPGGLGGKFGLTGELNN